MDGGFTAVSDVSRAMAAAGTAGDYRLIGGMTVMLHVRRMRLDLPLRGTADADFGVPPHVLRESDLVEAIEALGTPRRSAPDGSDPSMAEASLRSISSCRRTHRVRDTRCGSATW